MTLRHLNQLVKPTSAKALYALTAVVGVTVWLVPWLLFERREAWDHWTYFLVSLPAMALVAAYAAFRAKSRWWRWPLILFIAQYVTGLVLLGLGNLFPLTIVAFAILTVPLVITAWVGAVLGRRNERHAS